MAKKSGLSPKQELFCQEYLKDLNGTQAYIRAGYKCTEKSARTEASKLLAKPSVSSRIAELKDVRAEENKISADWVLKKLIAVAERSLQAEEVQTFDYETKQMVPTGEYQFDSTGANKALELIGKHIGLFDPKHSKVANLTEQQIEKIKAETKFIQERTKLLQGATKDTSLMEALIKVVKGE